MKVRRIIVNIIYVLLIVIGLILIFNKQIRNLWLENVTKDEILIELKVEDIKRNEKRKVSYDYSIITPVNLVDIYKAQNNKNNLPIIGGIAIPKVNLNMPIVKGMSNDGIAIGAETMTQKQEMGKGNYSLAGHNLNKKGLLFSSLYLLKSGDKIYLTDLENIYEYQINQKKYVDPKDVSVVREKKNIKEITLVCCNQDSSKRLIVSAKFSKKIAIKNVKQKELKYFNLEKNKYLAKTKKEKVVISKK